MPKKKLIIILATAVAVIIAGAAAAQRLSASGATKDNPSASSGSANKVAVETVTAKTATIASDTSFNASWRHLRKGS